MSNRRAWILTLVLSFVVPAATVAEVRYYPVPKDAHPHDVAPAPDGTVVRLGERVRSPATTAWWW